MQSFVVASQHTRCPGCVRTWRAIGRVAYGFVQRRWFAFTPHSLDRLQRREERLSSLVERLKLPRPDSITSNGKTRMLPIRPLPGQYNALSPSELEYLVGFFDGDGCVSAGLNMQGCMLSVAQSVDHAEVLFLFQHAFGGTISNKTSGRGFQRPSCQWVVTGAARRRAASLLGSMSSLKQAQLQIASVPRPTCHTKRAELGAELRSLKRSVHTGDVVNSWAYVAGFFDAEGCIRVPAQSCSIPLHITQNQRPVLASIQDFVNKEVPKADSSIYGHGKAHRWTVSRYDVSRLIVEKMLEAGLVVKQRSAELVLAMTPSTHLRVRYELARLSGNQSMHRRLDTDGCRRVQEISRIRQREKRLRDQCDARATSVRAELMELRKLHALMYAESRCCSLRDHARRLLRQGAMVA